MIFSILNLYYTNFEKSFKNLSFVLGRDEKRFFVNRRKIINCGFPCTDFKENEVKLGCIDIRFFSFNLPYFLYISRKSKYASEQNKRVVKSLMDYVSYKSDIVSYLYTILDVNREYHHDYVYDEYFYHVFNQYDYYSVFLYLHFFRNFVIFGGRETMSSDDKYDFVINLDYNSIVEDLRRGILRSIRRMEDVRYNEEYEYKDTLKVVGIDYFVSFISSVLNFIKEYFKRFFDLNVEYHRRTENSGDYTEYNEDDEDDEYGVDEHEDYLETKDYEMVYDYNVYYFVFLNILNGSFVVNLVLDYTFFDYIDQNYYHLFGDPFKMGMTLIKSGDHVKVQVSIKIDKSVQEIDNTLIHFDDSLMKKGNNEYRENDEGRFYMVNVLSILDDSKDDFVNDFNDVIRKIIRSVSLDKIHLVVK